MIYDCFQFFNELDLLKIRLNVLDAVADYFVITESTVTFSGEPKPLYYEENKEFFTSFQHKIIHNVIDDTPDVNPFERDFFQKNAVKRGLKNCQGEDFIIFSDLDEIPNLKKIHDVINDIEHNKVYHFAQRQFYFYINLEEFSGNLLSYSGEFDNVDQKKWLGTKMFKYSFIQDREIGETMAPQMKDCGIRVDEGGWHFTYMGGDRATSIEERVAHKVKSAAHQEFNNKKVLTNIMKNIDRKKDIFGRKSNFKRVEIDESYPEYIVNNLSLFEHLVLPKEEKKSRFSWFKRKF